MSAQSHERRSVVERASGESMTRSAEGRAALLRRMRAGIPYRVASRPDASGGARAGAYPLTPVQRGIAIAHEASSSPAYNCPLAIKLSGPLDVSALRHAMTFLTDRHSVLRLSVHLDKGKSGVQEIDARTEAPFRVVSLAAEPYADLEQRISGFVEREARRQFDLASGPLWRLTLGKISPEDHVAVLVVHHVISDGWSLDILVTELVEAYNAFVRDDKPAWRPAGQFVDLAAELAQTEPADEPTARISTAVAKFEDVTRLELPTDRPLPATPATHGITCQLPIDASLTEGVTLLARRLRVTRFTVVMAALQIVLSAHAGQRSFALATIVSGRTDPRWTRTVGPLLNVVLVRCDVEPDATVARHVEQVTQRLAAAQDPTTAPYETLIRHLDPGVPTHQAPLAPVLFGMPPPVAEGIPDMFGLQIKSIPLPDQSTRFELSVQLREDAAGLRLALTHDGHVRSPERVRRLGEAVLTTLRQLTNLAPQVSLASLNIESTRLSQRARVASYTLPMGTDQAKPGRSAVDQVGCLTDSQASAMADRVAARLIELGIRDNDVVGIECGPDRRLLPAVLGALRAGVTYCVVDPADAVDARGRSTAVTVPGMTAVLVATAGTQVLRRPDNGYMPVVTLPAPDGTALTGGPGWRRLTSTAYPVAERVMCLPLVRGDDGRLEPGVPVLWSQVWRLGRLLSEFSRTGAVPVVSTTAQHLFIPALLTVASGAGWLEFIGRQETAWICRQSRVIFADQHLLDELGRCADAGIVGPTGALVMLGPRLSTATSSAWARRGTPLHYGYVPTRCGLPLTLGPAGQDLATTLWVETSHPIWDTTLVPPADVVCIPGAPAELVVGEVPTGDRVLPTPGGFLQVVWRSGRRVLTGRRSIDLDQVEAALRDLPDVLTATAVMAEDGDLTATVALRGQTNPEDLLAELQRRVAAHLVPDRLRVARVCVTSDGFPLRSQTTGADRNAGRSQVPEAVLERRVIEVFAEILGRDASELAPTADFFEEGGHSLAAVRLVDLIRRRLRATVRVRDLFSAPTPASIARLIHAQHSDVATAPHVPVTLQGTGTVELVLVHPIGGELFCYKQLVEALGYRHVLGLPAAWSQLEDAGRRLIQVGRLHARALLESGIANPAPVLAGWSAGGIFALATAEALADQGVTVPAVVMMDSRPVDPDRRRRLRAHAADLLRLCEKAERDEVADVLKVLGPMLPPFGIQSDELEGIGPVELVNLIATWSSALDAMCEFATSSRRGQTVLIPATCDTKLPRNDAALWASAIPDIEVVPPVAADHFGMLRPPAVERVAEYLQAVIAQSIDPGWRSEHEYH